MHHGASAFGHTGHHAAYAHAAWGGNWFVHSIINGVIHAAIYRMIAPLFRGQGIFGSIAIGAIIIGVAYLAWRAYLALVGRRPRQRSLWRRP